MDANLDFLCLTSVLNIINFGAIADNSKNVSFFEISSRNFHSLFCSIVRNKIFLSVFLIRKLWKGAKSHESVFFYTSEYSMKILKNWGFIKFALILIKFGISSAHKIR